MKNLFLLFTTICLSFGLNAQQRMTPEYREKVDITVSQDKFHLYLLIGQSNMAGRGIVEAQDTIGNPRILRLNQQGEWEVAKDPVHFDKPVVGVGPGLTFAREMLADDENVMIGLIPCAVGGSDIDSWKVGALWEQTNSYPYDDAIARTKLALKDGILKGILWHQGESDCSPEKTAIYKNKLMELVATLRSEFHDLSVPFIAGEMAEFNVGGTELNQVLHDAKKDISNYDVVSGKGFTSLPDGIHLDAPSARELGKRYAEMLKNLLQQ